MTAPEKRPPMWTAVLIVSLLAGLIIVGGCAGMTHPQQRALSGGALAHLWSGHGY
jgi:hypothetical protein